MNKNLTDPKVIASLITGTGVLGGIILKYYLSKKKKVAIKNMTLTVKSHSVFPYLDNLERQVKTEFQVPENVSNHFVKQEIFKDIMINKIKIWRKELISLVNNFVCKGDCDSCPMTRVESRILHLETLSHGMDLYTNYFENGNYTDSEKKGLRISMLKFNEKHTPNANLVSEEIITTHTKSDYFKFCPITATGIILNQYQRAFFKMKHDIEKSIKIMNGDLAHIKFKRRNYSFFI